MLSRSLKLSAVPILAMCVAIVAAPASARASVRTICTMSGTFIESDARTVRETLDLSHDNSDYRLTDSEYYFDATATDGGSGSSSIYGVELVDKTTGEIYACDTSPDLRHEARLTAVVSGGEFIGDGAPACVALTSPVDDAALRKQMGDPMGVFAVLSSSFVDGPPEALQTVEIGHVKADPGVTVSVTGSSEGDGYTVPESVHTADLDKSPSWKPANPSHPESVTARVPAGASGIFYWIQSETRFIRRVTLRYGDQRHGGEFIKERTFDIPVTKFGPIHLSANKPSDSTPASGSDPNRIAASIRGLFFTGSESGLAPVYRSISLDSASAPVADSLTPIDGQVAAVITCGAALAPRIASAQWSDGAGGLVMQSVSTQDMAIPVPMGDAPSIEVRLQDMNGSVLVKKIALPESIDWADPERISVDFAVLDGLDSLDSVLGENTIWPGDDTIRNTCFAMIPESAIYSPMLLLPKSMPGDARAPVLKQLDVTPADRYAGRSWGMWGDSFDVYTVPSNGMAGLFGNLEPELGRQADIGFTSLVAGSPCSTEFIRLLPLSPAMTPLSAFDAAVPIGVAAHESFHAFMIRREIEQLSKEGQLPGGPPKDESINEKATASALNRTYDLDKVLDATGYVDAIDDLLQGAEATDSSVRIALYRKAVAARRQALDKLDKAGVAELTLKEDQEGSATYFGLTAEQALAGKPIPLPDRVEGGFGSIKTAPPGGRIPLFYQYGYLTCLALNAIQPGWQTAWLTNSKSLSEMLDADVADGTHP